MDCKKEGCCGQLKSDKVDSRQEWCDEYFSCETCSAEYTLHTKFKTQSSLIESQILYDENDKEVE